MTTLFLSKFPSPIGTLLIVTNGDHLCALDYVDYQARMLTLLNARYEEVSLQETSPQQPILACLTDYFHGNLDAIAHIMVETRGTQFQQQVWTALRTIPAGTTLTYQTLATRLARPKAARAVGAANALNPIAIVVPCHRLVGVNGALTGYAGGLERKQWLLQHEGVEIPALSTR
jgi:methylated-DNA-[protein]-cysteine S-methyltransferase